jgi:hypothetical protein
MNNNDIQNIIINEELLKLIPEIIKQEIEKGNQITITKVNGHFVMTFPSLKKNN